MILLWYFTCIHSRKRSKHLAHESLIISHNLWVKNENGFLEFLRSAKAWLRFIRQYWNWIRVHRPWQGSPQEGGRLEVNDLKIIYPSGDSSDILSRKNAFYPESRRLLRTCSDIGHQICPSSRSGNSFAFSLVITVNSIQTPASNREEEGTYISYD